MANALPVHCLRVAVLHDWHPRSRPNKFGEDMRTDQIHLDVATTLCRLLNEMEAVSADVVAVEDLEAGPDHTAQWDGAINLAYGEYGRFHMASPPMTLDRIGLPVFGTDPFQMLLARNKQQTKNIASQVGLLTPKSIFYDADSAHLVDAMPAKLTPCIVKPNEAASGLGLEAVIYRDIEHAKGRTTALLEAYPEGVLVETFVPGEDVTVAVLSDSDLITTYAYVLKEPDGTDLPPTYVNAYRENLDAYERGLRLWKDLAYTGRSEVAHKARDQAEHLVRELSISGYTRADYRLTPDGDLYFLELNGQAGIGLGPSVVTTIGEDHYDDRLGFVREFAKTAVRSLQRQLRTTKRHERWAHQTG